MAIHSVFKPTARTACAVLCIFHIAAGSHEVAPISLGADMTPDKWLNEWLASLKVNIPEVNTTIPMVPPIHVTIRNGVCGDFGLQGIDTQRQEGTAIEYTAKGIAGNCNMSWRTESLRIVNTGTLQAKIGGQIQGLVSLSNDEGNPPLPVAINNPSCKGNLKVDHLKFKGGSFAKFMDAMSGIIRSIIQTQLVQKKICGGIEKAVTEQASPALKNASALLRKYLDKRDPKPTPPGHLSSHTIDFSKNTGIQLVGKVIKHILMNESSPYSLNSLATKYLGPTGSFSTSARGIPAMSAMFKLGQLGKMNLTLRSAAVDGLNTFSDLELAAPSHQTLSIGAALRKIALNASLTLVFTPNHTQTLSGASLREDFDVRFKANSPGAGTHAYLALDGSKLSPLAINQLPQVGCVAPSIEAASFSNTTLSAVSPQTSLVPKSGDSLEVDLDNMINAIVGMVNDNYAGVIGAVGRKGIGPILNAQLSHALASPPPCGEPQETDAIPSLRDLFVGLSIIAAGAALLTATKCFFGKHRANIDDTWVPSTYEVPTRPSLPIDSSATSVALAFHPRIPLYLRVRLPLLVLASALLVTSSNFSEGAHVRVFIKASGQDVLQLPEVSNFSLLGSFYKMWDAGCYPLAIMVLVFSGAWPYVRLCLLLFGWFASPRTLSVKRRQQLLDVMDLAGRWSLPNCYMLMMFGVAFNFKLSVGFPEYGIDGSLSEFVDPSWAFSWCFLLGTCLSIWVSNNMCSCHRKAEKIDEYGPPKDEAAVDAQQRLNAGLPFARAHLPTAALLFSALLVVVVLFVKTVQLEFLGLLGGLMGSDAARSFSIIDLVLAMPSTSLHPSDAAVKWTQSLFLLWAALCTLANLGMLFVLWAVPLTMRVQRQCFAACRVLNAWGAIDVFAVSLIVVMMEIRQFAGFIVGDKCDLVNQIAGEKCFDIKATLPPGYWLLVLAAICATATGQTMLWKCAKELFPESSPRLSSGNQLALFEGREFIASSDRAAALLHP